jgi:hypothetical protein
VNAIRPIPKLARNAKGSSTFGCPTCGGGTCVIDSRAITEPDIGIRRRRFCVECQERFTTHELSIGSMERFLMIRRRLSLSTEALTEVISLLAEMDKEMESDDG